MPFSHHTETISRLIEGAPPSLASPGLKTLIEPPDLEFPNTEEFAKVDILPLNPFHIEPLTGETISLLTRCHSLRESMHEMEVRLINALLEHYFLSKKNAIQDLLNKDSAPSLENPNVNVQGANLFQYSKKLADAEQKKYAANKEKLHAVFHRVSREIESREGGELQRLRDANAKLVADPFANNFGGGRQRLSSHLEQKSWQKTDVTNSYAKLSLFTQKENLNAKIENTNEDQKISKIKQTFFSKKDELQIEIRMDQLDKELQSARKSLLSAPGSGFNYKERLIQLRKLYFSDLAEVYRRISAIQKDLSWYTTYPMTYLNQGLRISLTDVLFGREKFTMTYFE